MIGKDAKGYTLVELIIVVILMGLMLSFAAPRFQDAVLTDDLKKSTRELLNLIRASRNRAVEEHTDYYLKIDLEKNEYWYETGDMTPIGRSLAFEKRKKLPEDVEITDIWIMRKGKTGSGEISLKFTKEGYAQQSAIHLKSEDGRVFTIAVSPFMPKVEVLEKYIEYSDQ